MYISLKLKDFLFSKIKISKTKLYAVIELHLKSSKSIQIF